MMVRLGGGVKVVMVVPPGPGGRAGLLEALLGRVARGASDRRGGPRPDHSSGRRRSGDASHHTSAPLSAAVPAEENHLSANTLELDRATSNNSCSYS